MNTVLSFLSTSAKETEQFAFGLAKQIQDGQIIAFRGGMGMGKTTFTRGFVAGLGITQDVSSPTFALVNEYETANRKVYHFDMYRIRGVDDLYDIGFFDYLDEKNILIIEWSERIEEALPQKTIFIELEQIEETSRKITVSGGDFLEDFSN